MSSVPNTDGAPVSATMTSPDSKYDPTIGHSQGCMIPSCLGLDYHSWTHRVGHLGAIGVGLPKGCERSGEFVVCDEPTSISFALGRVVTEPPLRVDVAAYEADGDYQRDLFNGLFGDRRTRSSCVCLRKERLERP
jgi:hypothetical protein